MASLTDKCRKCGVSRGEVQRQAKYNRPYPCVHGGKHTYKARKLTIMPLQNQLSLIKY